MSSQWQITENYWIIFTRKTWNVMLINKDNKSTYDIALKLHRQFVHPTPEKLIKTLNSAKQPWSSDNKIKESIVEVTEGCLTCQLYQKLPPCLIVELPVATSFKECIVMDLEFYKGRISFYILLNMQHVCQLPLKLNQKIQEQYFVFGFKFMGQRKNFYWIMGESMPTKISLKCVKQWMNMFIPELMSHLLVMDSLSATT